ncbi:MAG TPA: hypothetical protein VH062_31320 [Polyangiaceae bacterium]|jgi:hypothetical protein|nr:hypothetical protein [Polyangiaceae bacterium]
MSIATRRAIRALFCPSTPAFITVALWAAGASANPRPLPFSYPHEQLPENGTELEQYVDFTTAKASDPSNPISKQYGMFQFQTEFEHGITDRLELGLYVTYSPSAPTDFTNTPLPLEGNGMKQRLRYKLDDTGAWPVDVAVYMELSENERELELEGKVILQRRFGIMRLMANVTAEQEFYYNAKHDFVFDPSAGVTFEATPSIQPGIEWWMRGEYPEENVPKNRPFSLGPHQYIGPALLVQMGSLWWTNGVYLRVSDWDHDLVPGETFGKLWIRSVIGYGF